MASTFARDDTLFGVCHALGEDFGFNPIWLRIAFALGLFVGPEAAAGLYIGCAAIVAASRWAVPEPAQAPADAEPVEAAEAEEERQEAAWEELGLAA